VELLADYPTCKRNVGVHPKAFQLLVESIVALRSELLSVPLQVAVEIDPGICRETLPEQSSSFLK
jgi:hypothetical protein